MTINFVNNTGATSISITSVLLNGIHYNESGWTGTVKPTITSNLTLKSVTSIGVSNTGTITFNDDCVYIPSGYKLTTGVTVKITIHTISGKDCFDFDGLQFSFYSIDYLEPLTHL